MVTLMSLTLKELQDILSELRLGADMPLSHKGIKKDDENDCSKSEEKCYNLLNDDRGGTV